MTNNQLSARIAFVLSYFIILLGIAGADLSLSENHYIYSYINDFSALFISIAAAYISYCYSSRQAHLSSLKELWKHAVETKGVLVQYTHLDNPTQSQYGDAHRSISTTIDLVRSVYRNVGETDKNIGLFPFRPLKDMMDSLARIGFTCPDPRIRAKEREQIVVAWNAFRFEFLKEFQTPEPPYPVTERSRTERRQLSD